MDRLLNKLERKFGRYCIENLMLYIVIGTGIVYAFWFLFPTPLLNYIHFDRDAVLRGQVWRVVSFVFDPESGNPIAMMFWLYFYWSIGSSIEAYWGSFKFNVYYFSGVIFSLIGGFITGYATAHYINLSLFLAMAALDPNRQILLFFFIPVKIKWLAWADAAFLLYCFVFAKTWSVRIAVLISVLSFILFFGGDFFRRVINKIKHRNIKQSFKR